MKLILNGEEKVVADGLNISGLISALKLKRDAIAVERNGEIVRRPNYENTALRENDIVEIVHLVGGGEVA